MPVIDAHIHLYPDTVSMDPVSWAMDRNESWWADSVAPEGKPTIQGWANPDQLLRDMDTAGIDRCIIQGWYWENQTTCDELNGFVASVVKQHPDRLGAFATVQPAEGSEVIEALKRSLDEGFIGIGELHPWVQGFSLEDPVWEQILTLAGERRLPVKFHVTDPVATPESALSEPTPIPEFLALADRHPDVDFILSHWGGGLPFYELNKRVRRILKRVYYDSAASPLLYQADIYRRVCDLVGADKILFGTDYPLLTHPRKSKIPEFRRSLEEARTSGLNEEELAAVLGSNAHRIGLTNTPTKSSRSAHPD